MLPVYCIDGDRHCHTKMPRIGTLHCGTGIGIRIAVALELGRGIGTGTGIPVLGVRQPLPVFSSTRQGKKNSPTNRKIKKRKEHYKQAQRWPELLDLTVDIYSGELSWRSVGLEVPIQYNTIQLLNVTSIIISTLNNSLRQLPLER